jgi:hypothetical protein
MRPARPPYRFDNELPAALAHMRDQPRWVAWDYRLINDRWTKPPIDPRTGRNASVSNPKTWATFDAALAGMKKYDLVGVGLVLTGNETGGDLDDCIRITDSGSYSYSELAAKIIDYGETYAEYSPSGEGIRVLALDKIEAAIKNDEAGVEVYSTGRYLTITGRQIEGTPSEIRYAPRTLATLAAAASREPSRPKPKGHAKPVGDDFFGNINAAALARLDDWVPALHPTARTHATGAWRITSKDLGRDFEEDLSYHPTGIGDYGPERGLTPIDAVLRYGGSTDPKDAAMWLCQRLGIEPASLGWQGHANRAASPQPASHERMRAGRGDARQSGDETKKRTQAQVLIEIARGPEVELFHSRDRTAYADINVDGHRETWALQSQGFRRWLRRMYYEETGGAPNSDAISTAMGVIDARAHYDAPERDVYLRVAAFEQRVYLDLCDDKWRAIEIDSGGWRVADGPPVRFRRTVGMLPIPEPMRGGSIYELKDHIRLNEQDDPDGHGFVLLISWLLAVLRGCGPYPILGLTGEQGTGKSFLADLLRRLVDPHTAPLRSLPRDVGDLYVMAINGHVLVFDNLSGITPEISDALCRLSTGGGFSKRGLYTDSEEVLFDGQRPIALTSITDVANRSDLAARLLMILLGTIPDDKRRPETELREAFEKARPRILGALLDIVAHGLMQLPHTRLNRFPRMADYALWIRACEGAIWDTGMHMAAYEANRQDAADTVLEEAPVAVQLRRYMERRPECTTTAGDLLGELDKLAPEHVRRQIQWPKSPRGLSGQLTRLSRALRRVGIVINKGEDREAGSGRRYLHIGNVRAG